MSDQPVVAKSSPQQSDAAVAVRVAERVGRLLLELRERDHAAAPEEVRRQGDALAHQAAVTQLRDERPEDVVLSEEAADDKRRLSVDRVWIVDPLDGTREYAERNEGGEWRDDFAVHVALWERGRGLTAGAVALPARSSVFSTFEPSQLPTEQDGLLRIAVSRTRPPAFITDAGASGIAALIPMGSAGVKAIAVVTGEVDAYLHAGGQYQWDSAAPVAVALAAGLVAERLDGSPLIYNAEELLLPDLAIYHPRRTREVVELLVRAGLRAGGGEAE